MAVRALHEMYVVRALGGFEGRIHGFHVEAAIGEAWMANSAGSPRVHAVIFMAGEATQSFMNAHGRAIVAGVDLPSSNRSMALIAESLPLVAADPHEPLPFTHGGQGQIGQGDGQHFPPVEERHRGPVQFLGRSGGRFRRRSRQGIAVVMHDMAIQTDDDGPVGKLGVAQFPWALGIDGRYQVANAAIVVCAVASQAIVHQQVLMVVLVIEEYLLICSVVQSRRPLCPFLLVAVLASLGNTENIARPESHLLRNIAAEVVEHPAHVVDVEASFQSKHIAVARPARDVAVRGSMPVRVRLPDLVATRAGFATGIFVINAGAGESEKGDAQHEEDWSEVADLGFWLRHL